MYGTVCVYMGTRKKTGLVTLDRYVDKQTRETLNFYVKRDLLQWCVRMSPAADGYRMHEYTKRLGIVLVGTWMSQLK